MTCELAYLESLLKLLLALCIENSSIFIIQAFFVLISFPGWPMVVLESRLVVLRWGSSSLLLDSPQRSRGSVSKLFLFLSRPLDCVSFRINKRLAGESHFHPSSLGALAFWLIAFAGWSNEHQLRYLSHFHHSPFVCYPSDCLAMRIWQETVWCAPFSSPSLCSLSFLLSCNDGQQEKSHFRISPLHPSSLECFGMMVNRRPSDESYFHLSLAMTFRRRVSDESHFHLPFLLP